MNPAVCVRRREPGEMARHHVSRSILFWTLLVSDAGEEAHRLSAHNGATGGREGGRKGKDAGAEGDRCAYERRAGQSGTDLNSARFGGSERDARPWKGRGERRSEKGSLWAGDLAAMSMIVSPKSLFSAPWSVPIRDRT